ncbi:histidine kinase [Labrys miyagiensis]|uniref:histidine kinase n=1 Tax=Labrys miyagiensis TaxID=346912 RepID=A0ABQ6CJB0_9HYPH|nr:HWE histidine kinase domain-containing protein [Labrys miyagiensis]GLS20255.1 histidine kinase [Labrys miyagiensis]
MGDFDPAKPDSDRVYITRELLTRPVGRSDPTREKATLLDLAYQMSNAPDQILPRFVQHALAITGGASAGLSLLDSEETKTFRWCYLQGELTVFEGAETPRDDSPCGTTLDQNATVLASHPERFHTWIAEAGIVVPEVLLVPLYLGSRAPTGTLWIVAAREGHFDGGHARAMIEIAAFVGIAIELIKGRDRLTEALDQQALVAREMGHRLNNLFAITDGLIRLSARQAATPAEMERALVGRLHALARANALVRRDLSRTCSVSLPADLGGILEAIMAPYRDSSGAMLRFAVDGPHVACGERSINGIALLFYELATNALKYGALQREGCIAITWHEEPGEVVVSWAERFCASEAPKPEAGGFGTTLIETTVVKQFGGSLDYEWIEHGLTITIRLQTARLAM